MNVNKRLTDLTTSLSFLQLTQVLVASTHISLLVAICSVTEPAVRR